MLRQIILISCLLLCTPIGAAGNAAVPQITPPAVDPQTAVAAAKPIAISKPKAVVAGMILAFNSGYSNGCCLGGGVVAGQNNQAVAAVTGAWTTSALGLAGGNMASFQTQLKALLSYCAGSCLAGTLIPRPKPFMLSDNTGVAFLAGAALWFFASEYAQLKSGSMMCFYLALAANGLQNSVTSVHTANLCRTAHFSGITSDMGTFLGQCLRGNTENIFKLKVFALLGLSFWLGSYTSFFATQQLTHQSLLFSAGIHFVIGTILLLKKTTSQSDKPFILDYII